MHGKRADELGGECEAYARKRATGRNGLAQPLRDKAPRLPKQSRKPPKSLGAAWFVMSAESGFL